MSDIDGFHQAELTQDNSHIWKVSFEVLITLDEGTVDWAYEEYRVLAGPDSQLAIDKARKQVENPEEYGMKIQGFRLKDVRLLAEADIL